MKEVNSQLQQEAEEKHKNNDDKEILVVTESRVESKTYVNTKEFYVATIKAME